MTISYPLDLPASPLPRLISMLPEASVGRAQSDWTLKEQIYTNDGDRWVFDVQYPPLTIPQKKIIAAFLLSLIRGGTFMLGDPKNATPSGAISGSPTVSGSHSVGARVLNITGTANQTGWVKKGDDLQIGNFLYTALADANVNGSGVCAIDIWPSIRIALTNGQSVIYNSPKVICRLDKGAVGWSVDPEGDGIYDIAFQAVEAL